MPELLTAADVCLLPSSREGMPVTAMESLAVGTPVITAESRGCRDVVRDEIDGIVLREAGSESIGKVLGSLMKSPVRLARLSEAAITSRERFDRGRFVERELCFYESLPQLGSAGEPVARRTGSSQKA